MYKKYKLLGVVLMILFVSFSAYSQVVLPQVFSDNMVLQRNAKVKVWGKSKPKAKVKIQTSWNGKMTIALSDKEGQWQTFLETGEAGGPFEITFDDGDVTKLSNILLGEVWLCSGQSNMNMPMKGWKNQPVANSNQQITMSSNDQIRLFQVKKTRRLVTQPDFNYGENWKMCDPENVAEFSAVAYHFGKMLQEVLDVPIGLIHSSSGGSRIEAWMSSEGVDQVDFVESLDPNMEGDFRN